MTEKPTSGVRWLLVTWLFVISSVAFLDRVNLSVAGTQLATDYRLSNVEFGALSTAFLLGYALFQTVAGWIADRWGPRRVLTLSVFWWGIFTALTAAVPAALVRPFVLLLLIRFLLGVGEAIVYPAANQFIARWIPTQERGIANGLIFAGVGVGSAATPALVTYIMVHHGWRYSFWICAIIGVAAGLVWFFAARDRPEGHPLVSPAELDVIRAGLTLGVEAGVNESERPGCGIPMAAPPWLKILTSREIWAMTLSYFSYGYVAWIFFAWFYRYLAQVRGLNLKASAFYATLPFAAIAIGSPLGGLMSDWLTRRIGRRAGRCGIAVFAMALAAVFLAFGSNVNSAKLASVILAGGGGALYLSQSSFWSVTADISGRFSGSVSGFMNMGAQFGGAVTAIATPAIAARFGWTASFLVAAALSLLGALAWLAVDPSRSLASEMGGVGSREEAE
jgi:MFS transporter, ACS family, glucarate transporter